MDDEFIEHVLLITRTSTFWAVVNVLLGSYLAYLLYTESASSSSSNTVRANSYNPNDVSNNTYGMHREEDSTTYRRFNNPVNN